MTEKKLTKKQATLEYLQNEAINLRKSIPTLVDAQYAKSKLVLTVRGDAIKAPELNYKGVKLDVVVETTDQEPDLTAEISEAAKLANEIRERHGVVPVESLHVPSAKPAVGPDGTGERRNQEAYDAWKKRFGK